MEREPVSRRPHGPLYRFHHNVFINSPWGPFAVLGIAKVKIFGGNMKKIPLIFVSLLCIYTSLSAVNLVKNPGFMEPQGNGPLPGSWVINTPERVSLEIAGGNTALKLSNAAGPQYLEASQSIPLD